MLGSFYFERAKMDLYFEKPNSPKRRSVQTTCNLLLKTLALYLSPVFSLMCEEVFLEYTSTLNKNGNVDSRDDHVKSVHLQSLNGLPRLNWADVAHNLKEKESLCNGAFSEEKVKEVWKNLMNLRRNVNVVVENGRKEGLYSDCFQTKLELAFFKENETGTFHSEVEILFLFLFILIFYIFFYLF